MINRKLDNNVPRYGEKSFVIIKCNYSADKIGGAESAQ